MNKDVVILVIDDDPDFLDSIKLTLVSMGFTVHAAMTGDHGLMLFRIHTPDIVFCDIMMERIDIGIDLVKKMRKIYQTAKIYLLSDIDSLAAANVDIYELGCDGILHKLFDPEELERLIVHAIGA